MKGTVPHPIKAVIRWGTDPKLTPGPNSWYISIIINVGGRFGHDHRREGINVGGRFGHDHRREGKRFS